MTRSASYLQSPRIVLGIMLWVFVIDSGAQSSFPNTIFYQIYTRGFYDSDGDGLGDFNGITEKLDYIKDLGAGALWIMPMFKSNTPHKYFSTDHMEVDPEYGSNEDLKKLVEEAHKRGLKVMIDFSINHVNKDNSWFLHSVEYGRKSPYHSYFHWVKERDEYNPETYTVNGEYYSAFTKNFKSAVNKKGDTVNYYYARFMDAPDLNFDNQNVRDYFLRTASYWVSEIGIDGLRLDAARHIYDVESGSSTDSTQRNFKWWQTFCDELHEINPEVFLLGEIWTGTEGAASYLQTGMDATFNFAFSQAMLCCVKNGRNQGLANEYLKQTSIRKKNRAEFGDATFLINHDMKRLLNELGHERSRTELALALLMTFPGSPFIYYGEELGFEADWHLLWLPMLWDEWGKDPGQTSWILGDSTLMSGYLTVQYDRKKIDHFQALSQQKKDPESWYRFYRNLMHLRKSSECLTSGTLIRSELSSDRVVSFFRNTENESLLVIHNVSAASLKMELPEHYRRYEQVIYKNNGAELKKHSLQLPAHSSLILK